MIDNVEELGAAAALTGPVARGDYGTVERHREAIAAHAPSDLALVRRAPARDRGARPMQVIDTIAGFRKALDAERAAGKTVGLVPTMGALHAGHASLDRRRGARPATSSPSRCS